MLDTRFSNAPLADGHSHLLPDDEPLPTIVVKAQEDVLVRQALSRLGYSRVRSAFAKHKRDGTDTFAALGRENLWPTMDFVRDWLKEERNRRISRARWPFLLAMLATIVAGLAFTAVATLLG